MRKEQRSARVLVGGEQTGGRFALVETIEQRGAEWPCHRHHWEDETLYVLEGRLGVYLAGTWMEAPAGTAVFLPRGSEHAFTVLETTVRLLTMLMPAGFERFYQERDGTTPGSNTASGAIEQLVTLAARHGCEITGPHPGWPDAQRAR